jgi:hypothetical protein
VDFLNFRSQSLFPFLYFPFHCLGIFAGPCGRCFKCLPAGRLFGRPSPCLPDGGDHSQIWSTMSDWPLVSGESILRLSPRPRTLLRFLCLAFAVTWQTSAPGLRQPAQSMMLGGKER